MMRPIAAILPMTRDWASIGADQPAKVSIVPACRLPRLVFFLIALVIGSRAAAAQMAVDLELVLAIDCSYSVDDREYGQQALGLAATFRSAKIIHAIEEGPHGAIAVSLVQWSRAASAHVTIPWIAVDGPGAAGALATKLAAMPRTAAPGSTSISSALHFASRLFDHGPFVGTRRVIDISADGRNNNGMPLQPVRAQVLAQGITINGLAILNEVPTLNHYFERDVIGGTGAFVIEALDYGDYVEAIRRKLLAEIRNLPIAGTGPRRQFALQ